MSKEEGLEISETHPEEPRSLLVHQGGMGLQGAPSENVLQEVGFSIGLPQRLGRLNEVLAPRSKGTPIGELSITLFPGKNPIIETDIIPEYQYVVELRAGRKGASILIRGRDEFMGGRSFMIGDLQEFIRNTFPDMTARLHAYVDSTGIPQREDFDEDLGSVTQDMINPFTEEIVERYMDDNGIPSRRILRIRFYGCEVRIDEQIDPLFVLRTENRWNHQTNQKMVVLHVNQFFYKGTPEAVERVMDGVTTLFDKPIFYPYRRQDIYPEEAEES